MLKRVLLIGAILMLGQSFLFAQADLSGVIDLIRKEKIGQAEESLQNLVSQDPKNLDEVYYWLGYIQLVGENYGPAETNFKKGIDENKKSIPNYAGLARIRMKEDKIADATELLNSAKGFDKGKNAEASFQRVEALLAGTPEMRGEARAELERMKESYPNNARPYLYLGEYYKRQNVKELAIEELEKGIELDPEYTPAYVFLAELYYDKGKESREGEDFQKGLNDANKAIQIDPEYASAYRIRAELYLLAKQFEKARDDMEKYVSQTQGDLKARVRFASFLYLSENYDEAITELDEIAAAGYSTNVMRRLKGLSFLQLGKLDEAQAAMDEYFSNVKKEEYIIWQDYEAYGDILREKGDLDGADEYYQKMILKNSEKSDKYEKLAEMYHKDARLKEKEARALKTEAKAEGKRLQEAYQKRAAAYELYKQYKEEGNVEEANAQAEIMKQEKAVMDEEEIKAKELIAKSEEVSKEALPLYSLEAHYREKRNEIESPSLQGFYKLAIAQYKAEMYEEADKNFVEVSKLKDDYLPPYQYRLRIADVLEKADTTSQAWLTIPPAEDIIKVFGDKAVSDLSKKEKQTLISAYTVMAFYKYNPTDSQDPADLDCEGAMLFIDKIEAIDPGNKPVQGLKEFCEQQR